MIDSPFTTTDTPLYIQIINVRAAFEKALLRLAREFNKSEADAAKLIASGLGRSIRPPWYDLAWEVVSCRRQLDELRAQQANEERAAEQAKRNAVLTDCPFTVDDRVLHKSKGSAARGADARVGIVRRIYTVEKRTTRTVRLAVDWPAPNRIGGDGWHRSDVLATAVIPATEEEIERRRALFSARNARLEAQWRMS